MAARELAEDAWRWVLAHRRDDDGPWLPARVPDGWDGSGGPGPERDELYDGIAGLALVLAEIRLVRPLTPCEQELAEAVADRLSREAAGREEPSLYAGLAGDAVALRLLRPGAQEAVLSRLVERSQPTGWPSTLDLGRSAPPGAPVNDLVLGAAGVVLAGVWVGSAAALEVATIGAEALLGSAEETAGGLDWGIATGSPSRMPNYSHGTAGVAAALAVAGQALGRADFAEAAARGAAHLVALASMDGGGLTLPLIIPHGDRDMDPVTYSWCHGPTGTSHVFAALAAAGVDEVAGWSTVELRARCLRAVLASGVPQRRHPGFWDNDGRCCGTAGVGDVLLDAAQAAHAAGDAAWGAELLDGARRMGEALTKRAVRDEAGARWQFVEHRQDPPLLPPGTGWMQGASGIAAYLMRLNRVESGGLGPPDLGAPVADRPDQWWAVPAAVRTVQGRPSGSPGR